MRKPPAQTIITWLRNNLDRDTDGNKLHRCSRLGALTGHDTRALLAAVQVAELWIHGDPENRRMSALAFNKVVCQMQPETRWFAFHAIAHVADWCHRAELWHEASLPESLLDGAPECAFGPREDFSGRLGRTE